MVVDYGIGIRSRLRCGARDSSFARVFREVNNVLLLDVMQAGYLFLSQLPNSLLQELPLWFLLGQRQSFLIRGPGLSCPAKPAVNIRAG